PSTWNSPGPPGQIRADASDGKNGAASLGQPLDGRRRTVEDSRPGGGPCSSMFLRIEKARLVHGRPRGFCPFRLPPTRVLIVALLAISGLAGGVDASGATLKSGAGRESRLRDHHLYCECAKRCRGDSCCCGPRGSTEESPVPARHESPASPSSTA